MVERCLAGDEQAWEQLYRQCHPILLLRIRLAIGGRNANAELVDEIAARVWHLVVTQGDRLLGKFDAARGCRLITFVASLADKEILRFYRSERRIRSRNLIAGKTLVANGHSTPWSMTAELAEFLLTLTRRERDFCEHYLLLPTDQNRLNGLSDANVWQLRHRVLNKLIAYVHAQ